MDETNPWFCHRMVSLLWFDWSLVKLMLGSILVMFFFMNLTVYTGNVYEPYATSHFKAHSLLATGAIVNGLVRIVSYPLLAKLANVGFQQKW
jgi:hypothetical protein